MRRLNHYAWMSHAVPPPWFAAFHTQLLGLLQRNQQRIDQQFGLRGRPSISAPLQAYGQKLEGVGEATSGTDALNQDQAAALLEAFGPTFLGQPHMWAGLQTFSAGLKFAHETLSVYDEGSFTATGTGFATPPTGTARYIQVGKLVVLYVPQLEETSNATTLTVTGLPAALTPAFTSWHWAPIRDNGVEGFGFIQLIAADPVLYVFSGTGLTFTNSGSKKLYSVTIPYLLA